MFRHLSRQFDQVVRGDLSRRDVDIRLDLRHLPFPDSSFDLVVGSHVLEHICDDRSAIREIARVLKAGGFALLPVPIVNQTTVDYASPNAYEDFHVRACGVDYYERYLDHFDAVELYRSEDFPTQYQVFVFEDRSMFPTERYPDRQPAGGDRHSDVVAVARKASEG